MNDYRPLIQQLAKDGRLRPWAEQLPTRMQARLSGHGDMAKWQAALARLPDLPAGNIRLDHDRVGIHGDAPLAAPLRQTLIDALMELHPWRKGPFQLHDVVIDTEWRSDWKWQRVAPHLAPLRGRRVLDIGCGNGYHAWRAAGAGASLVVGIDPTLVFVQQYWAMRRYLGDHNVWVLPAGIEDLAPAPAFDTVFSMGVLYHRRSPIDHLSELKGFLRPGGELVLETLVVEGDQNTVFLPPGRYARMRNVWFLPSAAALSGWLARAGFRDIRCVDLSPTTTEEQRPTDWMRFESLPQALDPARPGTTIEGHPGPRRATLIAEA